jgi:hypothetical protein
MERVIGVDFDNTLVDYSGLAYRLALERGLVEAAVPRSKRDIRDRIRRRPDGELEWQRLQADLYGHRIQEAPCSEGVADFARRCRQRGVRLVVVSHKSVAASQGASGVNLRDAARGWMAAHGAFDPDGLGLAGGDVFFEATRADKLRRIGVLGCTHFIDDLEETFLEPSFPASVRRILYAPTGPLRAVPGVQVCATWQDIGEHLFGSRS